MKLTTYKLGVVVPACDPNAQETETGGWQSDPGHLHYLGNPALKQKQNSRRNK